MIEVSELTKAYGVVRAIDQLDFRVERGEIVGFLGPNGAGKSTTMRILAGCLGATKGTARIGGIDVADHPRQVQALLGYLPERPPLYLDMVVRDYLMFCARLKKVGSPSSAVDRALSRAGLSQVSHRLIANLSKGYRQRVGIAQAIVHEPKVLILDEPASGLDPGQRVEMRRLIQELAAGDTTVLLSTHVLPEVEATCARVIIVDRGRIVRTGTVAELQEAGANVLLKVRRPGPEMLTALQAVAGVVRVDNRGMGAMLVECTTDVREDLAAAALPFGLLELREQGSLEDVFLRLTREEGTP